MPIQVTRFIDYVTRTAGGFGRNEWIAVAVVIVVTGLICMKGFGSRVNY